MRENQKLAFGVALLSMAVATAAVTPLFAQRHGGGPPGGGMHGGGPPGGMYRGGGPPGGGSRGGGDDRDRGRSWGGYRGPSDDRSRLERYEAFITSMDTNKNGRIDANEAEGPRGYFVRRLAERAKVDAKFPLSISRLRDGLKKNYANEDSRSDRDSDSRSDKKDSDQEPLVPAFGVEQIVLPVVLKFGERPPTNGASATAKPAAPSNSNGSSSRSSGEGDERMRRWAEAMIRQNDRNHNGKLERNEWGGLRGDPRQTDRNHDGVITREEMERQLSSYRRGGGSGGDSRSSHGDSRASRSSRSDSDNSDRRKSYRLSSPTERLPDGLLPWFVQRDSNGDGQVAMAEFYSSWTNARALEFTQFDLNGDGVITPKECLASKKPGPKTLATGEKPKPDAQPVNTETAEVWDGW